jgi:carbon starvation protein
MGLAIKFFRMPLRWATPLFLALVLASIAFGPVFPLALPAAFGDPRQAWNVLLLGYCFLASLVPVWLLLQPRGYLGGFFLYATLAAGLIGALLGGEAVRYPAFLGFVSDKGMPLFPLLFVTIACGACSGFHGIVCSGTTSKQIAREPDCRLVGYGGMLLEGVVAVLALATVMILSRGEPLASASPDRIYAEGLSRFVAHLGIPIQYARSFALLAFATFIYDTLDVATRLARQIFEELTGWRGTAGRIASTAASLAIPLVCVSWKVSDASGRVIPAWKIFWTVFGTSNQLLAALTLMVLAVWFKREGRNWRYVAVPMVFMMAVTFVSLGLLVAPLFTGGPKDPSGVVAALLLAIGALLVAQTARSVRA